MCVGLQSSWSWEDNPVACKKTGLDSCWSVATCMVILLSSSPEYPYLALMLIPCQVEKKRNCYLCTITFLSCMIGIGSDMMTTPQMQHKPPIIFPNVVRGTTSPYLWKEMVTTTSKWSAIHKSYYSLVHAILEESAFVVEENSGKEITTSSFSKSSIFDMFSVRVKTQSKHFQRVKCQLVLKPPSSKGNICESVCMLPLIIVFFP